MLEEEGGGGGDASSDSLEEKYRFNDMGVSLWLLIYDSGERRRTEQRDSLIVHDSIRVDDDFRREPKVKWVEL